MVFLGYTLDNISEVVGDNCLINIYLMNLKWNDLLKNYKLMFLYTKMSLFLWTSLSKYWLEINNSLIH